MGPESQTLTEISRQPHPPGQTKRAVHRATDLRGNTEGLRRCVRDEYRFDVPAVLEAKQELCGAVDRGLPGFEDRRTDAAGFRQCGSQLAAEVRHLRKIGHASAIDPMKDLSSVKAGHAEIGDGRFHFGAIEIAEVNHSACGEMTPGVISSLSMENLSAPMLSFVS